MDLKNITTYEWRRKRLAHFSEIVKDYTSFEAFIRDWDETMVLWGVEMTQENGFVRLYMQLDYCGYEEFHVMMGDDGHLAISSGVGCNDYCANMISDISNEDEYLDEYPEESI